MSLQSIRLLDDRVLAILLSQTNPNRTACSPLDIGGEYTLWRVHWWPFVSLEWGGNRYAVISFL